MHVGVTPTAKTGGEWEEAHVSPQRDLTKLVWRFSVRVSEGTGTQAREREWGGCWDQMKRLPASTPAQVAFKEYSQRSACTAKACYPSGLREDRCPP
jgi:hypothetical protein